MCLHKEYAFTNIMYKPSKNHYIVKQFLSNNYGKWT